MPTAVITGAGGGIGRAMAWKFSTMGHAVVLVGRTPATLEKVAGEIRHEGGETLAVVADVSKPEAAGEIVKRAMEAYGEINVLVNNAGCAPIKPLAEMAVEQWREVLDTNLSAAFYLTRAVWPVMARQHEEFVAEAKAAEVEADRSANTGGAIINVSSEASRDPFPGFGAYGAAKAGLNMLTYVTAREGETVGIRAIGIAPAAVETPMFRGIMSPAQMPTEEVLRPEEVAALAGNFVKGALRFASGETVFVHRRA